MSFMSGMYSKGCQEFYADTQLVNQEQEGHACRHVDVDTGMCVHILKSSEPGIWRKLL